MVKMTIAVSKKKSKGLGLKYEIVFLANKPEARLKVLDKLGDEKREDD